MDDLSQNSVLSRCSAQKATATDVSYDSLPSWGHNSTKATAIDPDSKADFPHLGTAALKRANLECCRRCKDARHPAKDCPRRTSNAHGIQPAKISTFALPATDEELPNDLLDLFDHETKLEPPTFKTLQEYRGEVPQLPHRARQWTDLDLENIRKQRDNVEDFQKRVTEPSLLDDEQPPDANQVEGLANAAVPVELKRKRKGKKGKTYYNLSPFVHY